MRHISLDLIRVTEAGAISASNWVGSGEKEKADKAATDAMRERLNGIDFLATIAIGEGEKDRSYGLFAGEHVGKGSERYEIAIDPIEGTTPTVNSGPEAISTIAIAHENCMYKTSCFYARKLAYSKSIKKKVAELSVSEPIEVTLERISIGMNRPYKKINVCILKRERHMEIIEKMRRIGVRIKLINDCDVSGAIAACLPNSGVDVLYGIGGAPEAVLTAAALKCLGGGFQTQDVQEEGGKWVEKSPVLEMEDLVKGECIFVSTGITDGSILKGVRWADKGPITNSVFMRSESGTVRWLTVEHGNDG